VSHKAFLRLSVVDEYVRTVDDDELEVGLKMTFRARDARLRDESAGCRSGERRNISEWILSKDRSAVVKPKDMESEGNLRRDACW
jgi:hypothetical protein